jgi:hypothetical protein
LSWCISYDLRCAQGAAVVYYVSSGAAAVTVVRLRCCWFKNMCICSVAVWQCMQAAADGERLYATFEALAEAALADGCAGESQETSSEPAAHTTAAAAASKASGAGAAASKVELLQRAEAAEQVMEQVHQEWFYLSCKGAHHDLGLPSNKCRALMPID